MARQLSQTLISNLIPSSFRKFFPRTLSSKARLIEIDLESSSSSSDGGNEIEVMGIKKLEDAIHSIFVRRLAPDWLPFRPGSSYWVPPKRPTDNIVELVEKLTNPLTQEESLSLASARGWPSSSFFLGETMTGHAIPVEVEVQVHLQSNSGRPVLSEDEE